MGRRHRINPDRIEAGTFLIAGAITGGDLIVADCNTEHLGALIGKLQEAACAWIFWDATRCACAATGSLRAADISTEEYPGFPTDMQAQYMALATQAEGASVVKENIFENRFMHVQELVRMGAQIKVDGRTATVRGAGEAVGGERDVLGPARLGEPGAGGAGGRWADGAGSRVPHRPRLRAD